ncbi:heme biosynthesis HemY N-terminal domain-containing protein [Achromobacter xylosoxidans]|uniref:heme biosynthesis HemY N-terminal domain-containing protein n=1 Tax=Alcaligenes xylosoxydans xylosoxydans TaxID=85698 RepID=UPI0006C14E99|nr:heme biosynthesis HemY N-terminal domain-containing protein [Achromobacter xylosoxidans]MCH4574248.1 protoheme IX synthesis protein [Achromobacter xylosoxidans]MDD7988467.1 heme biosynthesis HemY N-terminal domain-containing protein [Achromobacter xylosoxidans]NEV05399.1 protoheme IX synthesis protein [Achromobacter xylosoxidans]OFO70032.1 protoheme IX synthesis protein [Achromobacter xylosoxidans]OMG86943.1 protoheme IX synthesis protein [Achromobacter xylosoxidans]
MRTWFWTLLLAVIAVALAVVLRSHSGNVLLLVWPWRISMSLTLAVLLIVAAFVVLYVGLRLLAWLLAIPDRVRAWRGKRAQARDHELLERGWIGLLEGRYSHAEKDLTRLLDQTKVQTRRVLAALSAARAAHGLGEFDRRDRLLAVAQEHAGAEPGLVEATATVSADMLLDQGRAERALAVLAPLADGGARHLHTMRLLLRAHTALHHDEQVFTLARGLLRRNALARSEGDQLIDAAGAARLRAGAANDAWRAIWKDLKAEERLLPEIALAGASAFEAAGEANEAAKVLEAAIAVKFNPALVAAYARCDAGQVSRRLAKAETWLQQRPTDPDLLTALGMLCLNGQLWGQAERYLLRSLSRRSDAQTHALLGSLYDRLDRPADAVRHWRLATAASMALPVLAADAALPAADTGSDPYHVDAEGGYAVGLSDGDAEIGGDYPALPPAVAASASDYVLDPDARASKEQQARALAPEDAPVVGGSTSDIDEYFDSAPIPAAAFDNPVPTYTPATPAAPKPAAPRAVPVPTTKPPFKDDGSL